MNLILYHCADARSFRVLWALEELGLPYQLELMPFPPRQQVENYRAVNPLGTVPACLIDGALMTESAAIPHVLATRFGPSELAVAPHEPTYPAYLNFLMMGEATLTFPQTVYLRYARFEPPERQLPQAAQDYAQWFGARLHNALKLMGQEYACADRFTMADVSIGYAIMLALDIGLEDQVPGAARDYFARLSARAGFQRAKAAQAGAQSATGTV